MLSMCVPVRIFDLLLKWGIINHDPSSSLASGRLQAAQRMNSVAGRHKLSTGLPPGTACMFDFKVSWVVVRGHDAMTVQITQNLVTRS